MTNILMTITRIIPVMMTTITHRDQPSTKPSPFPRLATAQRLYTIKTIYYARDCAHLILKQSQPRALTSPTCSCPKPKPKSGHLPDKQRHTTRSNTSGTSSPHKQRHTTRTSSSDLYIAPHLIDVNARKSHPTTQKRPIKRKPTQRPCENSESNPGPKHRAGLPVKHLSRTPQHN